MNYLLDADITIDFFKSKEQAQRIFRTIGTLPKFMSVVVYAELLVGAAKSTDPAKRYREVLLFIKRNEIRLLPVSRRIAEEYVRVRVGLEKRGERLPALDTLIAATALTQNLILVTGNKKHFQRIKKLQVL